jgi:hypothetical protein
MGLDVSALAARDVTGIRGALELRELKQNNSQVH